MSVEEIKKAVPDAALSAAEPVTAPSVAVKALEWDHEAVPGFVCSRKGILSYTIMTSRNRVYGTPGEHDGAAEFTSLDEAKAAAQADYEARILSALSAQVQDVAEVSPAEYMRRHDAAIAAYEANTPNDYRYSALALRKAVDAAFAVAAAHVKQAGGE